MTARLRVCFALALLVACGHHGAGAGDIDGGGAGGDGGIDAPPFSGLCNPKGAACSNCKDDDGDRLVDGFDPQCTGPNDNDESSFSTGIPGDNKDPVMQDCFFDGDSGDGNDGCNIHVCCLLGARMVKDCPIGANRYDPNACPPPIGTGEVSQKCIDKCGKLTPPGCDCFGCCTICDPASKQCVDIVLNVVDSVGCDMTTLSDPSKCLRCTKNTQCGSPTCGDKTCILCPGQTPGDLPMECNGSSMCPSGTQACSNGSCPEGTYCSNGCCIGAIL